MDPLRLSGAARPNFRSPHHQARPWLQGTHDPDFTSVTFTFLTFISTLTPTRTTTSGLHVPDLPPGPGLLDSPPLRLGEEEEKEKKQTELQSHPQLNHLVILLNLLPSLIS